MDDLDRIRKIMEPKPTAAAQILQPLPTTTALTPVPDTLTLIGVSGSGSRRLALINDRAFAANESGKVRVGKTNVVVRCLEVRENSAVIVVEGSQERQESTLKAK